MTTKFPGCALLMELASFMKRRSMKVVVDWTPREGNIDADRLANGIVDDFSPDLEIKLDSSAIEWEVLPDALRMAREADSECKNLKQEGRLPKRDQRKRKKRPEERLRLRDPWWRSVVHTLRPCFFLRFSLCTPLQLRCCHVFGASRYGLPMPLCSIALPEPVCVLLEVLFLVLSPRLFSQLCNHKQLSVCEDGLHPAFVRRDHCWSHFPYFGEKVVYASFLLYVFSGSPSGQPEGGIGHPRVGLRATLPFHVLRLLRCVLVAHSWSIPCGPLSGSSCFRLLGKRLILCRGATGRFFLSLRNEEHQHRLIA